MKPVFGHLRDRLQVILSTILVFSWIVPAAAQPAPAPFADVELRRWSLDEADAYQDSLQVWLFGERFFAPGDRLGKKSRGAVAEFGGLSPFTARFLDSPSLYRPAVQFSDALAITDILEYEDKLEAALRRGPPELQLQALAILLRAKAPATVDAQYKTLAALQQLAGAKPYRAWRPLLKAWLAEFSAEKLAPIVSVTPPPYRRNPATMNRFHWAIRAAGVAQCNSLIPQLTQIACSPEIDDALAAERSLEQIPGLAAEEGLAACVKAWRYNAAQRAGAALLQRNRPLLNETLKGAKPPARYRYQFGLLLAQLDDPAAVPILCDELPRVQIIDHELIAQIARLARPEHRDDLRRLPKAVRDDQRAAARSLWVDFSAAHPEE